MSEAPVLGVDFGTSNCSMAWYNEKSGHSEVIRNAEGDEKTPSVVYFGFDEVLVGSEALQMLEDETERRNVAKSIKRELGKSIKYSVGGQRLTPVQLAAEIFKKLKQDAETGHFNAEVSRVVVTHPATFDELQKERLKDAATLAGFADVTLLPEPIAAALAYAHAGLNVGNHVLVYDLGGGTFDLAILARDNGFFHPVVETRGLPSGGDDFDRTLYQHLQQAARETFGDENSPFPKNIDLQLLNECRRRKESLSNRTECDFQCWLHTEDSRERFRHSVSRKMFEDLIDKELQPTIRQTIAALKEATELGHEVDTVVLIGGSSRIPAVQQKLQEALTITPIRWQQQDVAVALGAACYGHRKWEADRKAAGATRSTDQPIDETAVSLCQVARETFDRFFRGELGESADPEEATEQFHQRLLREAIDKAQAACDLVPFWDEPLFRKGSLLLVMGKNEEAMAAYTACLRLNESHAGAWARRGVSRVLIEDFEGAIADLSRCVELTPDCSQLEMFQNPYLWRSFAHFQLGHHDDAVVDADLAAPLGDTEAKRTAFRCIHLVLVCLTQSVNDEVGGMILEILQELEPSREAFQSDSTQTTAAKWAEAQHWFALYILYYKELDIVLHVDSEEPIPLVYESLQRAFWLGCQREFGGCTRDAAKYFKRYTTDNVPHDAVWSETPELAVLIASVKSENNEIESAREWLKLYITKHPECDLFEVADDPYLHPARHPRLKSLFEPNLSVSYDNGAFFNQITVTNNSLFMVHDVSVRAHWKHQTHGSQSLSRSVKLLSPSQSKTWSNVFKDGGWFGSSISDVNVSTDCRETQLCNEDLPLRIAETPATTTDDRCPQCGFSYAWDGTRCGHCKHS